MKGGAWLVLAVSALMGLGLTIGAIASRRHMSTAVVVVLCARNCIRVQNTAG